MAEAPGGPPSDDTDLWHTLNQATRQEQLAEDSLAWRHVVGLLLFIVSVGLVLALLTLVLSAS